MEIPVGYAQANFIFTGAACPTGAEITLGLDVSGFSGTPSDAGDALEVAWNSGQVPNSYTDDVTLASILVKFGPTATGPSAVWPVGAAGGQATQSAPPQVAYLIQKQTALGGRAGRGRLYLPGVPDNAVDDGGNLTGGIDTDTTTRFNDFAIAAALADLSPVLLHGDNSPISLPTPITSFACDSMVATQRRRLRR